MTPLCVLEKWGSAVSYGGLLRKLLLLELKVINSSFKTMRTSIYYFTHKNQAARRRQTSGDGTSGFNFNFKHNNAVFISCHFKQGLF